MVCIVATYPEFSPTVSVRVGPEVAFRGVKYRLESWSVAWGDGSSDSFGPTWPWSASHGYMAGAGVYAGTVTMLAETGETLVWRVDFGAFSLSHTPITHAGGRNTDIVFAGGAADTLDGGLGNDSLHGRHGDDLLRGGGGGDVLSGGDGANTLLGGAGDDTLRGGRGEDTLLGGNGDDWLGHEAPDFCSAELGGWGADLLNGGRGADTLEASGSGAARLQLGVDEDADVVLFRYSSAYYGPDGIANFNPLHDRIQVGSGVWPTDIELVIGNDPVATGDRWALLYDQDSGRLFIDAPDSLIGNYPPIEVRPVHLATLWGAPTLTAENFIL